MSKNIKYQELHDFNWLRQKYIDEQMSCPQIAKIVGCNRTSVTQALKRVDIPRRDSKSARSIVPLKSYKYDLLNNRDWLYQKYVFEGMGTNSIAQLVGVKTPNSVRQALIRFNIEVRSISNGLTINRESDGFVLTNKTQQIIEGGLLGDAMLRSNNRQSDESNPHFSRKNKNYDHVLWISKQLFTKDSTHRIRKETRTCNSKKCNSFRIKTLCHKELMPIYRKWYPPENGYRKIVPKDLVLTPTILLHWFLDDGTTSYRIRNEPQYKTGKWIQKSRPVRMVFCSESFTKEENEYLVEKLFDIGIKSILDKCNSGTGWRIKIYPDQVEKFFEIIGPCPVTSMSYKWKLPLCH